MHLKTVLVWAAVLMATACVVVTEHPRQQAGSGAGGAGGATGGVSGANGTGGSVTGGAGGSTLPSDGGPTPGGLGGTGGAVAATDAAADVPRSSGGVTINGVQLPKSKVLVFLHIGHSNMAGRVTTPEALRPLNFEMHPQLWAYSKGGVWKPAKEPLSPDSMNGNCGGVGCGGLPFGAGPGMSILRAALAAAPGSHVVSIGRGQSGLSAGYCRSFRRGGLLYDIVMAPAIELKGNVTFAGIWTMFGQSEVNDAANSSRVGDCLMGVANEMRADLGEPDLPFLVGDWEEGATGSSGTSSNAARVIIPQLRALPMRITRSVVIPTDGLPMNPRDGQHYDLTGYKQWAERGLALLKMNGWMPWATQ